MLSRLGRLEALPRTGWLFSGVTRPESIAAHSFEVATLAMWLADYVDAEVDRGRLATIALAHDAGEALLTDLPSPVKTRIGKPAVEAAEADALRTVFESGHARWAAAWEEYRERDSVEARLVKAADGIQMRVRALQYASQNRGDVSRFFAGSPEDYEFDIVARIHELIEAHYRDSTWYPSDAD